ncbi:MAG: 2-amino-4-hydroxy-6-hydroxymethyldihydropteridine diphosphokinase [Candidatus Competibacteraceae bacterium]|nr:2-amino-4-hydroxy-6-hydroxymethyldihydropteridine diphosphokinase [Candidatus Competibacteraceae bacterium]MCB1922070.1 2-amino-4-hydroxy-6-hydroxymethyldihydropteridine diphosphokinase [Candidatus Competibacteraceae bacterium]
MSGAEPVRAFIGLGSNLDDPIAQVRLACTELFALSECTNLQCSSLYHSAPMGPQDQPPYINAVAAFDTTLAPMRLLDALQAIELSHHRVREGQRWGPRTLDLDLLLYGDRIIDLPRLTVPHPGLTVREFVLHPLAEIAPDRLIPGYATVRELAAACPLRGLRRLTSDALSGTTVLSGSDER